MPSRKRDKGKERKAKKAEHEAKKVESKRGLARKMWQGWARGMDMYELHRWRVITQCNHGCTLLIPDDNTHPVTNFIDEFFTKGDEGKHIIDNLRDTFNQYPEVWNADPYRKMTRDLMLGIGTNLILRNKANAVWEVTREIAYVVTLLENYDGRGDINAAFGNRVVASKARDIGCGGSGSLRDLLKIYRKRTTCSCLKKMHLETRKTQPKIGSCYNCGQKKERTLLSVCSKCRVSHYCSRECQIAHWPSHKCYCDVFYDTHQCSRQNDSS